MKYYFLIVLHLFGVAFEWVQVVPGGYGLFWLVTACFGCFNFTNCDFTECFNLQIYEKRTSSSILLESWAALLYYKLRQVVSQKGAAVFYYKVGQVLQSKENITKWDRYYKV